LIELIDDPAAFAAAAGEWVAERVECTVLATVLDEIVGGRVYDAPPHFAVARDAAGAVTGVALRTPPWPMLASSRPSDAEALVAAWLTRDQRLPGVNAQSEMARAIGDAWARLTGGIHRLTESIALHSLQRVSDPPHPTSGALRRATPDDAETVLAWYRTFHTEAHEADDRVPVDIAEESGRLLLAGGRAYLWEDGGEPVSMLGHSVPIAGVPRVGPVYTPPDRRGRGYAGHAVAQLSRRLLAGGAPRCVLFTNLANPTSNKIYAEVGYRRVGDWERREFVPAAQAGAGPSTTG
jgi:predicted GNAT family acetyltransferase